MASHTMLRERWIAAAAAIAVVLLGVVWVSFMVYLNSRHTTLDVQVSGSVEQVLFFAASEPSVPAAQIVTHGQDTQTAVDLPTAAQHSWWMQSAPAQYYFVTIAGTERYLGPNVCCQTGFLNRRELLIIRALREWEKSTP